MYLTDPIADMLTRIRNANEVMHEKVDIPHSTLKDKIAEILKEEGYIANYKVVTDIFFYKFPTVCGFYRLDLIRNRWKCRDSGNQ